MVDETKDVSKSEQLSIVVRYLKEEQVRKEFLHFRRTEGLDADSLLSTIKQTLSQCNINPHMCVGQCYDGADVMSETRWSCQYTALVAIRKSLPAVKATFTEIMSQPNARRKTEARAVSGLIDEQFVLLLTLFEDLFRVTKFMSDQLQSPSFELSSAMDLADSVIATLTRRGAMKGNSGQSKRPKPIGDARNSNLGLLAINKQRSKALDVQRVIDIFASNHNNRRIVLL
ncbi:hypothetical protein JOQ06_014242 [Pogonophryne albipinna]|uniref:Uncharacterized protein n=1 Tax=Pogonophryne albipinna TaxID=1090488 RepID=A0AAD6F512_9TELE|nr:hypothetical protein JOQ06_014242 [Pogonophryne albipinna]